MPRNLKSPVRASPLRQPGQSLLEARNTLLFDRLFPLGTIILVLWLVAGFQWVWTSRGVKPDPLYLTVFAGLITLYGLVRVYPMLRRLEHLASGYKGGRVVGERLDKLRVFGYSVFHDVPGDGGNIDHVIISTRGVYTIVTKARKSTNGEGPILYDGDAVSFAGRPADPAPVIQAKAQAARLRRLLAQVTGRHLKPRPIVVFPGWSVEQAGTPDAANVWVLSTDDVYRWIERQPETVSIDVVRQASTQLAAFVRDRK